MFFILIKVKFTLNGNKFEIDSNKMIQKNLKTNFERLIRLSVYYNDNIDELFSWQWEGDDKKWVYYSAKNVIELENKYDASKLSCFDLDITNTLKYEIDFNKMKQTNKKTKFSRNIRRVESGNKFFNYFF